ncbi:hypothetical protein ACFX2J_015073 [Malus domestica]
MVHELVQLAAREFDRIMTNDALQFVVELQREAKNQIKYALKCRNEARRRYNEGGLCRGLIRLPSSLGRRIGFVH